ncbi:Hsp20 family protein [Reinekea sp. G2M2-21]|uniref:Hsp20 family protein n=1 Tax=Reinekea sp. G2M2-21 TaxID=2788942 RepID=UPI0018AB8485|nr:Hsp20 family protein [Reinekea sp. G2M2-21]
MRTAFDFSPLYRTTVGFDRIAHLLDAANQSASSGNNYPPYDIEITGENQYTITIAVAGFTEQELDIHSENGVLQVRGKKEKDESKRQFLYQGIAYRSFERKFQLADYVKVTGANLENGLLKIELLKEVPEAMRPKKIAISSTKTIEQQNNA